MMTKLILLLTVAISSCAHRPAQDKTMAYEAWIGRSTEDIKSHPYFSYLPLQVIKHDDGINTWLLNDQSRFQTEAYCQSLGGCMGVPTFDCQNIFSVKDGKVLGFEQKGTCPGIKTIEVPKK